MSLQCLWSDAIPSHFIHKSNHRKQFYRTRFLLAMSQERPREFWIILGSRCGWGRRNVQRKFGSVALHHLQTATTCGQPEPSRGQGETPPVRYSRLGG
ncbi:hypothetical protein GOODEAATRI_004726 [Goodea atripinnis]|uniref:Uncharacterized protein n=1 Tax=Goodea atripinnis TaxID=208336 RepID=A0ABV0MPB5_9TELE